MDTWYNRENVNAGVVQRLVCDLAKIEKGVRLPSPAHFYRKMSEVRPTGDPLPSLTRLIKRVKEGPSLTWLSDNIRVGYFQKAYSIKLKK